MYPKTEHWIRFHTAKVFFSTLYIFCLQLEFWLYLSTELQVKLPNIVSLCFKQLTSRVAETKRARGTCVQTRDTQHVHVLRNLLALAQSERQTPEYAAKYMLH